MLGSIESLEVLLWTSARSQSTHSNFIHGPSPPCGGQYHQRNGNMSSMLCAMREYSGPCPKSKHLAGGSPVIPRRPNQQPTAQFTPHQVPPVIFSSFCVPPVIFRSVCDCMLRYNRTHSKAQQSPLAMPQCPFEAVHDLVELNELQHGESGGSHV